MTYRMTSLAAIAVLTACNGAPPNEQLLTESCVALFEGDARTAGMIAGEAGTDLATFCGCFATQTVAEETNVDLYKDILNTMVEIRSAGNLNVEDTADQLETKLEAGEIDSFTEAQFDNLGDVFQDLSTDMMGAGGTCAVS